MSEKKMDMTLNGKSRWWNEPMVWLIIALPIAAVIGGITTVVIAYRNADTPAMGDYAKVGKGFEMVLDRERKAAELGVGATLAAEPGRLTLNLEGQLASAPSQLTLTLGHPTDSRQDMVLQMIAQGAGVYTANYAEIPAGKRKLELMPSDQAWRITGLWQAPFSGSTRLAAEIQVSTP
jgi:hypothetical protein